MPTLPVEGLFGNSLQNLEPGTVVATDDGAFGLVIKNGNRGMGNKLLLLQDEQGLYLEGDQGRELYAVAKGSDLHIELGEPAESPTKPSESIGLLGIDTSGSFIVAADGRPIAGTPSAVDVFLSMPPANASGKDWRWSIVTGTNRAHRAAVFKSWRLFYFDQSDEKVYVF